MAQSERGIGAAPGLAGLREGESGARATFQRLHEAAERAGRRDGDGSTRTFSRGGFVYEQARSGGRWVTFRMTDPGRSRVYVTATQTTTVAGLVSPQ